MTDDERGAAEAGAKAAELSCPACGEMVYPGETFCEGCGHRLGDAPDPVPAAAGQARAVREGRTFRTSTASLARRRAATAPPCTGCGGAAIDADGYCEGCGLRQPADRDHVETTLPADAGGGVPFAAGVSDRGLRYSRNEDALALAVHADGIAAVVSDGVGSSQRPDEASRAAADTGATELASRLDAGEDAEGATRAAARSAARAVAALSASEDDAPSCTYVSAVTRDGTVTVGWVGDSRAYWIAAGEDGDADGATRPDETAEPGGAAALTASRRLTEDDSWAAIMVAEGALTEAEAEAHPNAHVITAWLGADAGDVAPHVASFRPSGPGTLLVCSDGLWNYFPAARDLRALLPGDPAADPLGAARTLVRHALDAGGRDNITVAVVPLPSPVRSPSTEQHR
ncbi:protein phosphatase 2C domain-containing protein [Actinomadura algeriensis]|uniref:Serine/threonine protein phosphatase PrpC n=1 Tax=Actinomadura algeriensis TaxID=1679523 RepID=A0ABR9JW86_9ACTN|nr:protein phosphatase 2C domain-containing protein [Actinomadura algeriensis]MBE1534807.1 serine/threonine protein phosphatase PrpC [Actinomadura algeriensis]